MVPNLQCSVIAPCFCKHVAILPGIDAMSLSGFGYWVAKRVRRVRKVPELSAQRSSSRKAFPSHGQTFSWGLRSRTRLVSRIA